MRDQHAIEMTLSSKSTGSGTAEWPEGSAERYHKLLQQLEWLDCGDDLHIDQEWRRLMELDVAVLPQAFTEVLSCMQTLSYSPHHYSCY